MAYMDISEKLALEQRYPFSGSMEQQLEFLTQYAVMAPSVRQSQPWRFEIRNGVVELQAARERHLPKSDPDQRELIISCGAAMQNFVAAARHFGWHPHVEILPAGTDLLARMSLLHHREPLEMDTILFYALHKSAVVPRPFKGSRIVPMGLLSELVLLANDDATWLTILKDSNARETVGGLVSEGNLIQYRDREFRAELAEGIKPSRLQPWRRAIRFSEDAGPLAARFEALRMMYMDRGPVFARQDRELALNAPVLAVLGTHNNDPRAWLRAGQTLATVLLRCLSIGVHASFLNQPVQLPALRTRLCQELGLDGHPQMLFCLGYAESEASGKSRALHDVAREAFI
jgi:nitroreductase